ncbi:MAG: hypothetical protein RSF68_01345 [Myroides sp.]
MKKELSIQHRGKLLISFLLIFILGCSAFKTVIISEDMYSILITDYYRKYRSEINQHKYFSITSYNIEHSNLVVYNIAPSYNKAVLGVGGDAYYPKDYIQFRNKFFFIEGEITDKPSLKVFSFFKERNLIDSTMYKLAKDLIKYEDIGGTDGMILTKSRTKVATYVVCKNNNVIISHWRTNKSEVSAKNIEKAIKKGCN